MEAGHEVVFGDCSSGDGSMSISAVVFSLRLWESAGRPSERPSAVGVAVVIEQGVLLLHGEPEFLSLHFFVNLLSGVSEVGVGRDEFFPGGVGEGPSVTHHKDVVAASEWVCVHGHRVEDHFRVFSHRLACG